MGRVTLIEPSDASTLFERPKSLLKSTGLCSSYVKALGSPEAVCQLMVAGPPLVQPEGVVIVKALTKGMSATRVLESTRCAA